MEINKLLTKTNYRNVNDLSRIKYIVIHYVGATGGAEDNCHYFYSEYRGASAHYFVGHKGEIWQCVDDADVAWHCGDDKYWHDTCRNDNSIGIEMCCRKNSSGKWYFEDITVESTIELTKELMKKYNVPAENVIRHYDVTGKVCPAPYVKNDTKHTWDAFKKSVSNTATQVQSEKPAVTKYYRVRKSWNDASSQIGAFGVLQNAKNACDKAGAGYYVFDDNGLVVYPKVESSAGTSISGTASTGSEADQKAFWDYFLGKLGNEYGVAGLMGNISVESGFVSNNLQGYYESRLGYNDATYTAAVDNGTYKNFVNDDAGFGLAQWTYYSRKQNLLNYAKSKNKSIGDFRMQLDFLWEELQGYRSVVSTLKSAKSVYEASKSVHINYECPADQSSKAISDRAACCQKYYDKYAKGATTAVKSGFKLGEEVKLVKGAKYVSGQSIPSWVFDKVLYVREINDNEIIISTLKSGAITGVVDAKYLTSVTSSNNATSISTTFNLGDKVKLVSGAKFATGQSIASWVFNKELYVREINGDNIVISTLKSGAVTGVVNRKYLTRV